MRTLSAGALATLTSADGIEPILLVAISWTNGQVKIYSDRAFPEYGYEGRLLEVGNFDSFVNMQTGANNATASIKLEDSDGAIKNIFNNVDIQKRPVTIYQWFSNLPPSEAFVVFEGLINSPMIWNEGDRTLTIEALTHIEDIEFGFAVEDGQFADVPVELIGKAWPVPFGTVINMPALQMDQIPHGVTEFNYGISDSNIQKQLDEILCRNARDSLMAMCLSDVGSTLQFEGEFGNPPNFELYKKGSDMQARSADIRNSIANRMAGEHRLLFNAQTTQHSLDSGTLQILNGWKFRQGIPVGILIGSRSLEGARGAHYYGVFHGDTFAVISRANPYEVVPDGAPLGSYINAIREGELIQRAAKSNPLYGTRTIKITQDDSLFETMIFGPEFEIGETIASEKQQRTAEEEALDPFDTGAFDANDPCGPHGKYFGLRAGATPCNRVGSPNVGLEQQTVRPGKLMYIPVGTPVQPDYGYAIRYVVSIIPGTVVNGVSARATFQGLKVLIAVPNIFYTVSEQTFGDITATIVTLSQPLSTILGYDFENELFVDVTSPIGPNVMDILQYIIERWSSGYAIDAASFATARAALAPFPANFYLEERKNVFDVIRDISYQARLMTSFGQGTFSFRYLPTDPTPVDTITESDVISKSLEVTTTQTEDLVTQYKALWQNNYAKKEKNVWVLQNNVRKYGLHKKEYNIQIFNEESLVEQTAAFWLIRTSNTFKIIKCKLLLRKLNLEVLDTVTLDFVNSYVANGPVPGLILKSNFNPSDWTIDCEIWVPVLLGTMVQFFGATPTYSEDILGIETQELGTQFASIAVSLGGGVNYNTTVTHAKIPKQLSDVGFQQTTPQSSGFTNGAGSGALWNGNNPSNGQPQNPIQRQRQMDQNARNQQQGGTNERNQAPGNQNQGSNATNAANAAQPFYNLDSLFRTYQDLNRPRLQFDGGAIPAQIVSKGDVAFDGAYYTVNAFINGLDKDPTQVKALQLQLDPAADIPPKSWVLVVRIIYVDNSKNKNDGKPPKITVKYYMQVPVWLKDS